MGRSIASKRVSYEERVRWLYGVHAAMLRWKINQPMDGAPQRDCSTSLRHRRRQEDVVRFELGDRPRSAQALTGATETDNSQPATLRGFRYGGRGPYTIDPNFVVANPRHMAPAMSVDVEPCAAADASCTLAHLDAIANGLAFRASRAVFLIGKPTGRAGFVVYTW
jgi:hypothetical protein